MKRVKKSISFLHTLNIDYKGDSWNGLIVAAQTEIRRIEDRAVQLREAIDIFKKRENAGDPPPGMSATQN